MEIEIRQIVLPEHNPETKDLLACSFVYDIVVLEAIVPATVCLSMVQLLSAYKDYTT